MLRRISIIATVICRVALPAWGVVGCDSHNGRDLDVAILRRSMSFSRANSEASSRSWPSAGREAGLFLERPLETRDHPDVGSICVLRSLHCSGRKVNANDCVRRRCGLQSSCRRRPTWPAILNEARWRCNSVDGLSTMAERRSRARQMKSVHTPAMKRSATRKLGAGSRPRFRMSS
jgi:hypothetical protein